MSSFWQVTFGIGWGWRVCWDSRGRRLVRLLHPNLPEKQLPSTPTAGSTEEPSAVQTNWLEGNTPTCKYIFFHTFIVFIYSDCHFIFLSYSIVINLISLVFENVFHNTFFVCKYYNNLAVTLWIELFIYYYKKVISITQVIWMIYVKKKNHYNYILYAPNILDILFFICRHIRYCMKYVYMLLSHNIKPILVFDGRHLPAKLLTEEKRRE